MATNPEQPTPPLGSLVPDDSAPSSALPGAAAGVGALERVNGTLELEAVSVQQMDLDVNALRQEVHELRRDIAYVVLGFLCAASVAVVTYWCWGILHFAKLFKEVR